MAHLHNVLYYLAIEKSGNGAIYCYIDVHGKYHPEHN